MSAAQEEDFVDYEEDEETAQEAKAEEKDTKNYNFPPKCVAHISFFSSVPFLRAGGRCG